MKLINVIATVTINNITLIHYSAGKVTVAQIMRVLLKLIIDLHHQIELIQVTIKNKKIIY